MCKDNKKNDTRTKGGPKKTKSRSPLLLHRLHGLAKVTCHTAQFCLQLASPEGRRGKRHAQPFVLREGGTVVAFTNGSRFNYQQHFERIDAIPVTVSFASSVESDEGDAEHMTDGNPNTYWHTMYSVTVANYPHWVDFDCGAVKTLKGFSYLPRQDSSNGHIKDYEVQVSMDGKTWSQPVATGAFANSRTLKRVIFNKPVRARYLRFTAKSSQDGQDFATCAEFNVLEQ